MLSKENIQDIYGLAPMQEGMLIHYARDATTEAYVEQFSFVIEGEIDYPVLQKSLDALVIKYDVLRTIFSFRKTDLPRQVVLKARRPQLLCEDYSVYEPQAAEDAVEEFKRRDKAKGFDLSKDILLRVSLLKVGGQRHHMIMTFHHIILDGWCMGLIFQDLFAFYDRISANPLLEPKDREAYSYRQFIAWVGEQDKAAAAQYWSHYLEGYQAEVGPPYFDLRHDGQTEHAVHIFSLGQEISEGLESLAKSRLLTVSSVFQTAWGILLQKYQNTDDVVFGSVVSGRPASLPGVESMVGLFINTQPLRVACSSGESFGSVAARVQQGSFQSVGYEYYPLFEIQSKSALKNRLLNHIVAFENYPLSEQLRQFGESSQGLRITDVKVFEQTNYDFNVIVYPGRDIGVNFTYNRKRYDDACIAGLERGLHHLLAQIVEDPDAPVSSLGICSPLDSALILNTYNATATDYPSCRSLLELFVETASARPDAAALRYRNKVFSYLELQQHAMAVGGELRERGIGFGSTVALMTPNRPEMVVAILAILSCGAAYVPIEPGTVPDRVKFLLEDSGASLVCTLAPYAESFPPDVAVHILNLSHDSPAKPLEPWHQPVDSSVAAYVMYTSGSTGRPKACVVSHRNIVRLVRGTDYVEFGSAHRILQTGSPAFDASTFEIWGALLNGAELCQADEADILDPARLRPLLQDMHITMLWLTSALFNQHCEADPGMFRPLRYLLVGGDVLSPRHIDRARTANPGLKIINGYGPTENTTFSTTFPVERAYETRIPIGRPIKNSTAYVLDVGLNLLPPGAYGELCVGGDGVASRYLNRPELSAEKFIDDPFRPGGRLYRTGDVARWLPDGTLDLLGRTDFQVKIRGFRVELGEIERTLCTLPGVIEVVVIVRDGLGGKQLCAYHVSDRDIANQDLRSGLATRLPGYMVPAFYLRLDRLPLTANGKVDRRALPPIDIGVTSSQGFTEPRNVTELRIAGICEEVLGISEIGVYDNFFDVGANSLNLITINNRLRDAFAKDIPVTALFEHTSVAQLAEYIGADAEREQEKIERENEELEQAKGVLLKTRNLMRNLDE
jgi:amino acid adenylation domain-containing protein